jgi:hypothetical protein
MKNKWLPITSVIVIVVSIVAIKTWLANRPSESQVELLSPQVILVATSEEAASRTRCGDIVRLVRSAAQHGIKVQELTPDSKSELLTRYRVMATPTVLIFGSNSTLRFRYEGESAETLEALRREIQGMIR